jgi:hypothetical protein
MKPRTNGGLPVAVLLFFAVVACRQPDSPPEGPFELIIQTFPPTGVETATYTKVELFDESGALLATGTVYSTPWVGIGTAADPRVLDTGRYYVRVSGLNSGQTGPYGLSARRADIGLIDFAAALSGNDQDAAEPDDAEAAANVPATPVFLDPFDDNNSRANRYIGAGDVDWFTFELP